MLYEHLFRGLNEGRVRYVVVGGVAMVLHGVVRLTADLDLAVDLAPANVQAFLAAMTGLGYVPRLPVRAVDFADPANRAAWKREIGFSPQAVEAGVWATAGPGRRSGAGRSRGRAARRGEMSQGGRCQDYAFQPSGEMLAQGPNLSAEEKLEWLECALRFVEAFVPDEARVRWDSRWARPDSHASVSPMEPEPSAPSVHSLNAKR